MLSQIKTEDFDPNEDIVRVVRKGKTHDKLGSVFVMIASQHLETEFMNKKKDLAEKTSDDC